MNFVPNQIIWADDISSAYDGVRILHPSDEPWIATDYQGNVYSFETEPRLYPDCGDFPKWQSNKHHSYLGYFEHYPRGEAHLSLKYVGRENHES